MWAMAAELGVPEGPHVGEVGVEAAGGDRRHAAPGQGYDAAEAVGDDDVVVVDGVRAAGTASGLSLRGTRPGEASGSAVTGATGGVDDAHAAVDGDVGVAVQRRAGRRTR